MKISEYMEATAAPASAATTAKQAASLPEIIEVLEAISEWWKDGGAPLHASALILDDDRTIEQAVNDALAKARGEAR